MPLVNSPPHLFQLVVLYVLAQSEHMSSYLHWPPTPQHTHSLSFTFLCVTPSLLFSPHYSSPPPSCTSTHTHLSPRLWVLRKALSPTLKYEADSLLSDISLAGHRLAFVSMAEPLGSPSPLEQWESVHRRVVGRLEETPTVDVGEGGGGGGEGRGRSDSMDMVDLG